MSSFSHYPSRARLQELSRKPYDLTCGGLTEGRVSRFVAQSCGYRLLYATERVDEQVIGALFSLAQEADVLTKMKRMQNGEIINAIEGVASERRAVLHTSLRDFFDHANTSPGAAKAAAQAKAEVDKLKLFIDKIAFSDLLLIGIGGSQLGPEAHYEALAAYRIKNRRVHFIANVDPDAISGVTQGLDLKQTLVVVVSKSGTTLETLTNEAFVRDLFVKQGVDPTGHFVAVTGEGSPMDDPVRYLEIFYLWDWVGGRYSTTSMVGGLMLAFACGFEAFWELLKGANIMDKSVLHDHLPNNLPLLGALLGIWNRDFLGYPTLAIVPYAQPLHRYTAHLQQLDMESNGKQCDKKAALVNFETGPIIWGEVGTSSQHSFFQLLHQGTIVTPLELVAFHQTSFGADFIYDGTTSQQKLLANLIAQMIALASGKQEQNPNRCFFGNRPSRLLFGEKLTPFSLGSLLSYFEHKVVFQGFIWNINSFDQEGVELGKQLTKKILKGQSYPLAEAFFEQLDIL